MKRVLAVFFFVTIGCAPLGAFGQSPASAGSETPPAAAPAASPQRRGHMPADPEERKVLMAAAQKARQDPAVIAALDKMRAAMQAARDAMVAKDKSLGPLMEKLQAAGSPSPGAPRPLLTSDERDRLRAARESIAGTPEDEAWRAATAEYVAALRQAMIAADPSVAPMLEKMPQGGRGLGASAGPAPTGSVSPH